MTQFTWRKAWSNNSYRTQFIITVLMITGVGIAFPTFFDFIEGRSGSRLHDFVLNYLPTADVAWMVFFFEYSAILLGLLSISRSPLNLLIGIQTYVMVTLLRMLAITLFPLTPPDGYIAMREPFVQLISNHSRIISKDLFFSGHVASACSLLFAITTPWHKYMVGSFIFIAAVLLLVQRNHYTIDIVAAPVITYGCYLISKNFFVKKCQA